MFNYLIFSKTHHWIAKSTILQRAAVSTCSICSLSCSLSAILAISATLPAMTSKEGSLRSTLFLERHSAYWVAMSMAHWYCFSEKNQNLIFLDFSKKNFIRKKIFFYLENLFFSWILSIFIDFCFFPFFQTFSMHKPLKKKSNACLTSGMATWLAFFSRKLRVTFVR